MAWNARESRDSKTGSVDFDISPDRGSPIPFRDRPRMGYEVIGLAPISAVISGAREQAASVADGDAEIHEASLCDQRLLGVTRAHSHRDPTSPPVRLGNGAKEKLALEASWLILFIENTGIEDTLKIHHENPNQGRTICM